jgi:HK97 family phage prohead protease
MMKLEFRSGELRASSPGKLSGYVARFGSETRIGDFFERVMPGAFRASLADGRNIIALADHDRRALLGSTASGTLSLREDGQGLAFELALPATSVGKDIAILVERKDIQGMSFGFTVPDGGDVWLDRGDGSMLRELRNVNLAEITITASPAYLDTSLAMRSRQHQQTHVDLNNLINNNLWLSTVL